MVDDDDGGGDIRLYMVCLCWYCENDGWRIRGQQRGARLVW